MRKTILSKRHIVFFAAIPVLFPALFAVKAFCLPCRGLAVNINETMDEVASKCGQASLKEQRTITIEETGQNGTRRSVTSVEEWTYDRGQEEPVLTYRFENGKLANITSNGYGTMRDFAVDVCRNGESLAVGDSVVETYLKCGDPIAKEKMEDKAVETENDGIRLRKSVSVSEWTYRYGPNAPGYTIRFENGVASGIKTKEFGK